MEVKLKEKDAADWVYRGEGAANIVVAYTGSSPSFVGKVMRLQKVERNGSPGSGSGSGCGQDHLSELTETEKLLWREAKEVVSSPNREIAEQLFAKLVISPLLGPDLVDVGTRVLVSREFLESVEKNVISSRPDWRIDAAKVDTERDSVLLMSDHSVFSHGVLKGGPCLAVEIKPKCGFLPMSRFIAEANAFKRSTTRFRMHQVLKLRQREISELSEYNPLDLFSGSKERILNAIKDLYTTPQNNFRVFLNGSLILGGLGGGTEKTNAVTGGDFEGSLKGIIRADDGLRTSSFIQLIADAVYSSGVLNRLLEVQKHDKHDIEGAIHAYYNIISQPCAVCKELDEARFPHIYAYLHSLSMEKSLMIVKDFLISATAKDCSLIFSFRPREDGEFESPHSLYLQATGQNFDYKVNFIDLDLRPLKKMEDYYQKDKKILNCYAQMVNEEHFKENTLRMEVYEAAN